MQKDEMWRARVHDAAGRILAPLATDGARFDYDEFDAAAGRVVIRYSLAECADCAIAPDDLAALVESGIERALGSPVTVTMIDRAATG